MDRFLYFVLHIFLLIVGVTTRTANKYFDSRCSMAASLEHIIKFILKLRTTSFTCCYALDRCRSRPMSTGTLDVGVRKRLVHALSVGEQIGIWIISWISAVDMMTLRANTGLLARLICALWCWCQENRNRTLAFRCGENVVGCGEGLILSKCHASHSFLRLLW